MIDLSIIIPHYNTPSCLKTMLESIPTHTNIQVIVVDDKSDKDTVAYHDLKNSNIFRHVAFLDNTTAKKSAGTCRNIGLQKARGKWILFADSDDFFLEDFYFTVEKFFQSEYDVVFFVPTSIDVDTQKLSNRHLALKKILIDYSTEKTKKNELSVMYKFNAPWSKLIKTELIHKFKLNFDETPVANDVAFSTQLGYHMKSFSVCLEEIYCVTNNTGSLTRRISEKNYDTRIKVFIWKYNYLKNHLSKADFKLLDLSGISLILERKYKLKFRKIIKTILLLKKHKVKLVSAKYCNPFLLYQELTQKYQEHKNNKRFFIKE